MRKISLTALAGLILTPALIAVATPASAASEPCTRGSVTVATTKTKTLPGADGLKVPTEISVTAKGLTESCVLNVSSYKLLPTYKPTPGKNTSESGRGDFNASASGQVLIKNRVITLTEATPKANVVIDSPLCGWFQWDVYTGPVLEKIDYPKGHSPVLIAGAITNTGITTCTTTPYPSASPSPSVTPSATPSVTPSATPSATPSVTPSATPSVTPSATPSESPSESPSVTPSVKPSSQPSPSVSGVRYSAPEPKALPHTGGTAKPIVLGALLLLLFGGGFVFFSRKAKASQHS